jgi:hypothetical protein
VEWLPPWWDITEKGREFAAAFEQVLLREVAPGHPLYEIPVEAIGRRDDNDDVLFRLLDGSDRLAVVHLTWTQNPPERPPWPATELYSDLQKWVEEGMQADHEEYRG